MDEQLTQQCCQNSWSKARIGVAKEGNEKTLYLEKNLPLNMYSCREHVSTYQCLGISP